MFRRLSTLAVIAAAASSPYVASETEFGRTAVRAITGSDETSTPWSEATSGDIPGAYGSNALHQVEMLRRPHDRTYRRSLTSTAAGGQTTDAETLAPQSNVPTQSAGPIRPDAPVADLREVLRFDITPEWVTNRFSRVTTVLAETQLRGMRVPLVTGTQPDDIAGTLTYYFDPQGKLQRVNIHGFTGNPDRLIGALIEHFKMSREPSLEAGVFTRRWNGVPVHVLRLTHAPVVYADDVYQKYTLFVELNDPNLVFGLSRQAAEIVESDRSFFRW